MHITNMKIENHKKKIHLSDSHSNFIYIYIYIYYFLGNMIIWVRYLLK